MSVRDALRRLLARQTSMVFAVTALVVLAVSVAITLRRANAAASSPAKRFSGSAVIQSMPSILPRATLASRVRVAIVRDASAVGFYESAAPFDAIVERWRRTLAAAGADVVVLDAAGARADRSAQVLVVPSTRCLSADTRDAIDAVTRRGGGVVLTGAAGTYDGACRPLGWGLVVEATGASRADSLDTRSMVYVTLPGDNPLTVDIPPGSRLDLAPARQVALRHPVRDAYYSDYTLQPQPAGGALLLDGAISHGALGRGRVVYFGFELGDAIARPWNDALVALLVRNAVTWAASRPIISVEPWPNDHRSAAVIAQDVEAEFGNAVYALDSLKAIDIPSTFFVTSDLARRHASLTMDMANHGEIGTHSENHRLLGGQSAATQRARLATTQRDLSAMLILPVQGLRPPEEQFDSATMSGWLAAGGDYLLGANDLRTSSPELLPVGDDTIVLLGRTGSDDFAAVAGVGVGAPVDTMAAVFLREAERAQALGGLYVFSYHSQLLSRPALVPVLARVARSLAADSSIWLTTAERVAAWWRERSQLEVTVDDADAASRTMHVSVRNRGERVVRGAVVHVALPSSRRVVRASTGLLASDDGAIRLLIPPVPSHAVRRFDVTLRASAAMPPPPTRRARRPTASVPWWRKLIRR